MPIVAPSLRSGKYGDYYGSLWGDSITLNTAQKTINAAYIYAALSPLGWTLSAIAGLLGNLEHESAINPGRWEGDDVGNGPGYGLVQWSPYSKYTDWCTEMGYTDPSTMDTNLARIQYERKKGIQYYPTEEYPLTFEEFITYKEVNPYYLACAFAWNYERSAVVLWGTAAEKQALREARGGRANYWYNALKAIDPSIPDIPVPPVNPEFTKRDPMSLILMYAATRRRF